MIAYIKGPITYKNPAYVIIETGGIGYQVHVSLQTFEKIQDKEHCKLYTYFHVKEDGQSLYGFENELEKYLFVNLISVSGIGPNTGRMILSALTAEELQDAIVSENVHAIQAVKGIGPKSAKRLILELKDKLKKDGATIGHSSSIVHNRIKDEALTALTTLGFSKLQAEKALASVIKSGGNPGSAEELVKLVLRNL